MAINLAGFQDLASELHDALVARGQDVELAVLETILGVLFYASLRTEEGEPVRCQVVYLDPRNPDPDPPERIVADRWRPWLLDQPIPLTVANVVKLAKATDPRTSSLAVWPGDDDAGVVIWGLADQGNRYHDFINFDSESGPSPPGVFLISIEALGHLKARIRYLTVAELRTDAIVRETEDVLRHGPVFDALRAGISAHVRRVEVAVGQEAFNQRGHTATTVASDWLSTLCRILIRARRYGHGGAVVVVPADSRLSVNIKHGLRYDRLRSALETRARATILWVNASDEIFEFMDSNADEIPTDLYLEESIHDDERTDNRSELDSAIWFVSLLTRIDGAVVLDQDLSVMGFGVEITSSEEPANIVLAKDPTASVTTPLPYTRWARGTGR